MRAMSAGSVAGNEAPSLTDRIASAVRAHAHGVSQAILFGSVARGEDRPDSDVDMVLVWPNAVDEDARWDASMRIAQVVDGVAGRVCIPLVFTDGEYEHLSDGFAGSLARDGVDLLSHGI